MEGQQSKTRHTRSTFSCPPAHRTQEETQQDMTMANDQDRSYAKVSHSPDLSSSPSGNAAEKLSDSTIRNYLLYDSAPCKTELPGDLKSVQLYFDREYKPMSQCKLLHVQVSTGEILLSELVPATRRLWSKWLHEWLDTVNRTLKTQLSTGGAVVENIEPSPYETLDPAPPRVNSPNREHILNEHFRNLRQEECERQQAFRIIRQNEKDEAEAEGLGAVSDDMERAGPDSGKKNKAVINKRRRQKKALAKRRAADAALEAANKMSGGNFGNNTQNLGPNLSGQSTNQDTQQTPVDLAVSFVTTMPRAPLAQMWERHSMDSPATGVNNLPIGTPLHDVFERRSRNCPATGVNNLPIRERPMVSSINSIKGGTNAYTIDTPVATGVNNLPFCERPTVSPITPINEGTNAYTIDTPVATGVDDLPMFERPTVSPITPINEGTNADTIDTPVANEQHDFDPQDYEAQDMDIDEAELEIKVFDELDTAEKE